MSIIYINKAIEDLVPYFLDKRQEDILSIKDRLRNNDREAVKFIAHSIKGSAGSYGFDELGNIATEIELNADHIALIELEELCNMLEKHFNEIQIVYTDD